MGTGLIIPLGLFLAYFLTYLSYHMDRSANSTPVYMYKDSFLDCTEYVANLIRSSRNGNIR